MSIEANANISEAEVSLVVTRADGSVEDLGVVAYYNKSARKRFVYALKTRLKNLTR